MKKAFTMIELIFVIVIIGILAAVAIPKLVANRTDAEAQICVHEVGQFLVEVSTAYTREGYNLFKNKKPSNITNILIGTSTTLAGKNGLIDAVIDTTGASYYCNGEKIMTYKGSIAGSDYNLTVTVETEGSAVSPIANRAIKNIRVNILNDASFKVYKL
jgi:general secretion pathway protein G